MMRAFTDDVCLSSIRLFRLRAWLDTRAKRCSCHYVVVNSTSFNEGIQKAIAGESSTTYFYFACVHAHIILADESGLSFHVIFVL